MDKTAQAGTDSVNNTNQAPTANTTNQNKAPDQPTVANNPMPTTSKSSTSNNSDQTTSTSSKSIGNQPQQKLTPEQISASQGTEFEPITPKEPEATLPDTEAYEVPKEVEMHVEKAQEKIEIPKELEKKGVTHPPQEQQPITDISKSHPPLPMTDDQIGTALSKDRSTSIRWLAEWCVKQLKTLHIHLKKVHGHFVEVKD